ncbi:hypothetical protein [Rhodococcus zopfii]|uniref:hypothetical protein n=1 Tax=Rhodococcus zopfii TaxID=43772 RepID=UPI0009346675|nr:hypothetical protein [Rhodococcus zopfii]
MHASFPSRHPVLTGLGALLVLGFVLEYWPLIVLAGVIAATMFAGSRLWDRHLQVKAQQERARAALAARADYEHQQYIAGNPVGLFGQYTPHPDSRQEPR